MNEQEFFDLVAKELNLGTFSYNPSKTSYNRQEFRPRSQDVYRRKFDKDISESNIHNDYLYISWSLGSSSANYSEVGQFEPENDDLDAILDHICPDISFLKYKRIVSKVVKKEQWTKSGYYGDSHSYAEKSVNLKELYDTLVEMKLIEKGD